MPKPVQMRASYRDDAAFLLRLEAAVSKDVRQTEAWRKETVGKIHDLAVHLLTSRTDAPAERPKQLRQAR